MTGSASESSSEKNSGVSATSSCSGSCPSIKTAALSVPAFAPSCLVFSTCPEFASVKAGSTSMSLLSLRSYMSDSTKRLSICACFLVSISACAFPDTNLVSARPVPPSSAVLFSCSSFAKSMRFSSFFLSPCADIYTPARVSADSTNTDAAMILIFSFCKAGRLLFRLFILSLHFRQALCLSIALTR